MIESLNIFGRLSLFFFVYIRVFPRLIPSLSPSERKCMYRQGIVPRTAIRDDSMRPVHAVGELGAQGSSRNKGRSFLKLGVPTPFHDDTIR